MTFRVGCALGFALVASGCAKSEASPSHPSAPTAPAHSSAERTPVAAPPETRSVAASSAAVASARSAAVPTPSPAPVVLTVPHDKKAFALFGDAATSRVVVYLHGRCGDPLAFSAWSAVAREVGTLVSLEGEVKCDGGRTKWSADTKALDLRITRALELAEAERGVPLDKDHRLVIGYSAGALRAEALATTFPDRYPRVILIGGPRAPKKESLGKTEAILLMAGQLDIRQPLIDAADALAKSGRHAHFLLIPHAHHGEYGPEAEATMRSAFEWVLAGEGATGGAGAGAVQASGSPNPSKNAHERF